MSSAEALGIISMYEAGWSDRFRWLADQPYAAGFCWIGFGSFVVSYSSLQYSIFA